MMIKIKRVYQQPEEKDGFRILVDRLWPRGVSKEKAKVDLWFKEIAPSDELRKWYAHDLDKWPEFQKKYGEELRDKSSYISIIKDYEKEHGTVTLVYAAKDEEHNNARVLMDKLTALKL